MRNVECEKCKDIIKNLKADNLGRVLFADATFVYMKGKYYHVECEPKVQELTYKVNNLEDRLEKLDKAYNILKRKKANVKK